MDSDVLKDGDRLMELLNANQQWHEAWNKSHRTVVTKRTKTRLGHERVEEIVVRRKTPGVVKLGFR
jgi:hypothetical protein